jgi:hypothetical protein
MRNYRGLTKDGEWVSWAENCDPYEAVVREWNEDKITGNVHTNPELLEASDGA